MIVYSLPTCPLNDDISLCSGFFDTLKFTDESGSVLAEVPAQLPNRHLALDQTDIFKAETFPKLCREILYREAKEILTNMEVENFG